MRHAAMTIRERCGPLLALSALLVIGACRDDPVSPPPPPPPGDVVVPDVMREFRGLWIATVANIDWPSRAGLTPAAQQLELTAILDRAVALHLNTIVLQIRPAGDALYRSAIEPWSRSLTGEQGGDPGYDPLAFAIQEAHQRGLELHAWFNPFRAGNVSDTARFSPEHFAMKRPDLRRVVGTQLWFDPGEQEVQDHTIAVILDVVRRYAIDGVHLDDFFYPYPAAGAPRPVTFPDSAGYAEYVANAGPEPLAIADWRRDNVNRFVERLYREVKLVRAYVRVGISPFGIWRPGNPPGVVGLDAYSDIFADSRRWLQQGWVDYLAPQLYWAIASTGQSFPALLDWWIANNTMRRHLWPGLAAYRVADGTGSAYTAQEIIAQIGLTRANAGAAAGGASGTLLYNTTTVRLNRGGLADALSAGPFREFALAPAYPWIDAVAPARPIVSVAGPNSPLLVTWQAGGPDADLGWWLVRIRSRGAWTSRLLDASVLSLAVPYLAAGDRPDAVAVAAVDRAGNLGADARWP
jgi:uncharacterized lipoprotein YddW (UPF0748 family)